MRHPSNVLSYSDEVEQQDAHAREEEEEGPVEEEELAQSVSASHPHDRAAHDEIPRDFDRIPREDDVESLLETIDSQAKMIRQLEQAVFAPPPELPRLVQTGISPRAASLVINARRREAVLDLKLRALVAEFDGFRSREAEAAAVNASLRKRLRRALSQLETARDVEYAAVQRLQGEIQTERLEQAAREHRLVAQLGAAKEREARLGDASASREARLRAELHAAMEREAAMADELRAARESEAAVHATEIELRSQLHRASMQMQSEWSEQQKRISEAQRQRAHAEAVASAQREHAARQQMAWEAEVRRAREEHERRLADVEAEAHRARARLEVAEAEAEAEAEARLSAHATRLAEEERATLEAEKSEAKRLEWETAERRRAQEEREAAEAREATREAERRRAGRRSREVEEERRAASSRAEAESAEAESRWMEQIGKAKAIAEKALDL